MAVRESGDTSINELKTRLDELKKLQAFIGWLDSARYDDGTPVAGIAALHEYGSSSKGIPPRPFLRVTSEEKKGEWKKIIEEGARAILKGTMSANDVMELLGLKASGDIKNAIKAVTSPALAPSTVESRKRKKADGGKVGNLTKPLVEEAIMINSVTYKVGEVDGN